MTRSIAGNGPAGMPTSSNPKVTFGYWERDDDIAPVLGPSHGFGHRYLGMRLHYTYRRRRFEIWWENGQKMGRWTWEYDA